MSSFAQSGLALAAALFVPPAGAPSAGEGPEFRFNGVAPAEPGKPERVGFHAGAATQRAQFKMTRELLGEIGKVSKAPDVWIEIDAEALRAPPAKQ